MMPSQRTAEGTGSHAREQNSSWLRRISRAGRLQSVKQALPTLIGISKNFHNHL
jgi:hypothetical protein